MISAISNMQRSIRNNSFETYSTEDIVESILHPTDNTTSDDFDAENDVANDDRTVVDSGTAKECLKKLLEYFQSSKNDSTEHVKNLIKMNTFIANECHNNLKQDVLSNYFSFL